MPLPALTLLLAEAPEGASASAEAPAVLPMVLIGVVLLATFAFIAFDWLHRTVAAMLGAGVAVVIALAMGVYEGEAAL